MTSPRWYISDSQWQSINKGIIKYFLPLVLVFLVQVQSGQPLETALYTVYGAALQLAINIISKLVTETK